MKILQINTDINTGSTGRIAEQIGRVIQREGWESYVYWGRGGANKTQSIPINYPTKPNVILHKLKTALFDRHGLGSSRSTKQLIEAIKRVAPNLIHLHNIHGFYLNYELLFQFLHSAEIPVVWTLHDCWSYTGHCAHYTAVECEKWKTQCHDCPQLAAYPKSWFVDNSTSNYALKKKYFVGHNNLHLVPVSTWLKKEVEHSFFKEKPITVINNGVDLSVFKRAVNGKPLQQARGKFILLSVAAYWSEQKGLTDLITLSELLREDEVIVAVGLSPQKIAQLPKNIIGLERTESVNELVSLYSQAGVVVSLSLEESFGMTPVEGFACGTPALVYNSTATPELITPDTGRVVEPHDFQGLRKAIDELRSSPTNYIQSCRAHAEKNYNQENCFANYIALYKKLLTKK